VERYDFYINIMITHMKITPNVGILAEQGGAKAIVE
jgi:hypothetical protein